MNKERLFSYSEPGGERGEIYEHFTITETELRRDYREGHGTLKNPWPFEVWLTNWLDNRNGFEIIDSYPYEDEEDEEEDTRGCA